MLQRKNSNTIPCPPPVPDVSEAEGSDAQGGDVRKPERRLVLVFFDEGVCRHALLDGRHVVGRLPSCDIHVSHPTVSREHAVILVAGGRAQIADLSSQNGTRVNGNSLRAGEFEALKAGDMIEAGSLSLFVRPESSVPSAFPPPITVPPSPTAPAAFDEAVTQAHLTLSRRPQDLLIVPSLKPVYETASRVAQRDIGVLVYGETGAGKEGVARSIHHASPRRMGPLIVLNCAALPETLIESELFGYTRGAFTGATKGKPGLLLTANGGSMFLDEIGELPLGTQAKLLRVLEANEIIQLGSDRPRKIDVRFIAATNRDLQRAVARGTFREDLYHRLNGVTIRIPPLREWQNDIIAMAEFFANRLARQMGLSQAPKFTPNAEARLLAYPWPGNVRELRNMIERAMLLAERDVLDEDLFALDTSLPPPQRESQPSIQAPAPQVLGQPPEGTPSQPLLSDSETDVKLRPRLGQPAIQRDDLLRALTASGGNQAEAAKLLGVSRRTLINWIETWDLPRPRKRAGPRSP